LEGGHSRAETIGVVAEDIDRALAGDHKAMDALVRKLRPVIQAEVGFALLPLSRSQGRDARHETLDLVQDVLMSLLADDAKQLRRWDPARGSSLEGFVRLIARRHVAGVVRSKTSGRPRAASSLDAKGASSTLCPVFIQPLRSDPNSASVPERRPLLRRFK
jgi:DNA-directed RNA polymerase specialized sigma24 family protein